LSASAWSKSTSELNAGANQMLALLVRADPGFRAWRRRWLGRQAARS